MQPKHPNHDLGQAIVDHINSGAGDDAPLWAKHYHPEFESVEADGMTHKGLDEIQKKHHEFYDKVQLHSCKADGPYCGPTGFTVRYTMDIESKDGQWPRMEMNEIGMYTVKDGKIVREEFMAANPAACE
ncbi:MAG: nuclear transport factor 2 family protein [Planctomycetota bacterium]